jgi:hypothetical protein
LSIVLTAYLLHVGQHVAVGVQGDGYGGVPPKLLDDLWVGALLGSNKVAQVCLRSWKRTVWGRPAFSKNGLKDPELRLLRSSGYPDLRRKHQIRVLPQGGQQGPPLQLAFTAIF